MIGSILSLAWIGTIGAVSVIEMIRDGDESTRLGHLIVGALTYAAAFWLATRAGVL